MANKDEPNPPAAPNVIERAIKKQRNDLGKHETEGASVPEAGPARAQSPGASEVTAELEGYRDQLRDYEKALVDRIADVDDDRRATESRLQRAWQTQREEIDDRLRRHAGLMAGLLILFAVLFAVALFLVYRQATTGQPDVVAAVAELRQELRQPPQEDALNARIQGRLEGLSSDVEEMASSLERLAEDGKQATQASIAALRADREQSEAALAEEVRSLGAEQGHLAEALESLRSVVQVLEAGGSGEPAAALAADESSASRAAAPVSSVDAAPAEPEPESEPADALEEEEQAAPLDQEPDAGLSGPEGATLAAEGGYALQLIGFFDQRSLDHFVVREGLPARVYTIRQTYKDRPWHVVIHSLHEDYAAAEEELSRLPPALSALNPWIRPMSEGTELRIIETGQDRR